MKLGSRSPRILVVRRENIGDLVCTTPLIHALRKRFPNAYIACLVNMYNADIVDSNPDIDTIYSYLQNRHTSSGLVALSQWWKKIRTFALARNDKFDYVILATLRFHKKDLRLLRALSPKHIVAFSDGKNPPLGHADYPVKRQESTAQHIVEELASLLQPFGIEGPPPAMRVYADPATVTDVHNALSRRALESNGALIGVHISSRHPQQRWPTENFIALMLSLHYRHGCRFMLFWSPGDENNPLHPGDDSKAAAIVDGVKGLPVLAHPSHTLRELVAGLAVCDTIICSDGGAMHVAAGLGKPIVCFFGNTESSRWFPWAVPHRLLQPETCLAKDISVDQALAAYDQLCADTSRETHAQ